MPNDEKSQPTATPVDDLATHLEQVLVREYRTALLSGPELARALGYGSLASLHQAVKRRTVPIKLFPIKDRRGKFALVKDIARWIAEQRAAVGVSLGTETDKTVQTMTEGGEQRYHGA